MASGKHMDEEDLQQYLLFILKKNECVFDINCDIKAPNLRFTNLIETVYQKTGKQVVVAIDEYDAPMLDVVHDDNKYRQDARPIIGFRRSNREYDHHHPLCSIRVAT